MVTLTTYELTRFIKVDEYRDKTVIAVRRLLLRLSRNSLLNIALQWLDDPQCGIHISRQGISNIENNVKMIYHEWITSGVVSRKDVVERILEVDWSNGLNAKQIAMLDLQYLYDHPTAIRWTACHIDPHETFTQMSLHMTLFLDALHETLDTSFSNHIYTSLHPSLPLRLLRIQLHEPATSHVLPPPRRVFYVALPLTSPYLFHSTIRDTSQALLLQAVTNALSLPRQPIQLRHAHVTLRSLPALMTRCGVSRASAALGAWNVYANDEVDESPLDSKEKTIENKSESSSLFKIVTARFGQIEGQENALDRLAFRIEAEVNSELISRAIGTIETTENMPFRPSIWLLFEGNHVLSGLKEMCFQGHADARQMPSWLTGDEGVTEGIIRDGRLVNQNEFHEE
ncbi:hypothetical protein PCANB_000492 [Pneumocystis canis]|nr:hypothetical protein PCANB_000492 [Pneumocystis canis]